jgi:(R)-2-hydroxyacyl-CoA dehydratese activating ATPase
MVVAGIDAGSRAIKVVLWDTIAARVLAQGVCDQGGEQARLAEEVFEGVLRQTGLSRAQVVGVVATGYGRNRVAFASTTVTEITCHARGVHHLDPAARSIVEIGGQDSKVIRLEGGGQVRDFAMNDRCAAGTGRFLEVLATRLGLDWPGLDVLSRQSRRPAVISSTCVVFAETEIIGLLAEGVPAAEVAAGVQHAIANRVTAMVGRALEEPVAFTGGVALQPGMARALAAALGLAVRVPPQPQFTGALGAAILAGRGDCGESPASRHRPNSPVPSGTTTDGWRPPLRIRRGGPPSPRS